MVFEYLTVALGAGEKSEPQFVLRLVTPRGAAGVLLGGHLIPILRSCVSFVCTQRARRGASTSPVYLVTMMPGLCPARRRLDPSQVLAEYACICQTPRAQVFPGVFFPDSAWRR